MGVYFTSDTHFGSQRTLELSKRPYTTTEEMDDVFVKNWNATVNNEDTVFHLGDFGDYNVINKLNGNVVLLCGNYEENDMQKENMSFDDFRNKLLNLGFGEVTNDKIITFEDKSNNMYFPMTHCPEDCDRDKFNLFGHIHKLCMVKRYGLNVGLDSHNFKPIDLDTVLFYKNAIENFYDNNVFE